LYPVRSRDSLSGNLLYRFRAGIRDQSVFILGPIIFLASSVFTERSKFKGSEVMQDENPWKNEMCASPSFRSPGSEFSDGAEGARRKRTGWNEERS
jgi:hypothetical protein